MGMPKKREDDYKLSEIRGCTPTEPLKASEAVQQLREALGKGQLGPNKPATHFYY